MYTMSMEAERLLATPCAKCGHPVDAHSISGCVVQISSYDPDSGRLEDSWECGCPEFVAPEGKG